VLHAQSSDRQQELVLGKGWVEQEKGQEQSRINNAIAALGVDWSQGARPKDVELTATVSPSPEKKLTAGELVDLEVTAENHGKEALHRIRAWTESDDPFLDRREFVFGEIPPGQKRSWKVPIRLPKDLTTRREDVTVKFYDDQGPLPTQAVSELDLIELPRPSFAFNWQVIDDCDGCNGNGIAERGEQIKLTMQVTNTGPGKALSGFGYVRNAADENIFIDQGRAKIGELLPGQTKTISFVLDVKPGYQGDSFPVSIGVVDDQLEEIAADKITLPVGDGSLKVTPKNGFVRVADGTELFAAPRHEAKVVDQLPKGGIYAELGQVNGYDKIALDPGRFAFVPSAKAREVKAHAAQERAIVAQPFRVPPKITVNVDNANGGLIATGDKFTLSGTASDPQGLIDVYILVNDQKVAFDTAPSGKTEKEMKFSAQFPLKEGNNYVMVVARQSQDYVGKKMLVIRRRPPAIAQALEHEGLLEAGNVEARGHH
jgi:carboxyl-terminal processing protease